MSESASVDLAQFIRDIPDFPKPGILFKDITPLLSSPEAFQAAIDQMADHFREAQIDVIVGAEARGFIFAAPLALALGVSFVPIRKPGKLPFESYSHDYDLEYGSDRLEIHVDGVTDGNRVLIVDDLLATGGTVQACIQLLQKCGAEVVGTAFVIELVGLQGAEKIAPFPVHSLLRYEDA
jgi:adenine phosphoribosyltransferase